MQSQESIQEMQDQRQIKIQGQRYHNIYKLDEEYLDLIKELKMSQQGQNQPDSDIIRIGMTEFNAEQLLKTQLFSEQIINQFFSSKLQWTQVFINTIDSQQKEKVWIQNLGTIKASHIQKIKLYLHGPGHTTIPLIKTLSQIQFHSLKTILLNSDSDSQFQINSLQFVSWMNMPNLINLLFNTCLLSSLKPLEKTNFKNLRVLNIPKSQVDDGQSLIKYREASFSRMKFGEQVKITSKFQKSHFFLLQLPMYTTNQLDFSDYSFFAKIQCKKLNISLSSKLILTRNGNITTLPRRLQVLKQKRIIIDNQEQFLETNQRQFNGVYNFRNIAANF